jgi:queuine tRNA-ribosyltransferase
MKFQYTRNSDGTGVMETPHGSVQTPIFMPVGTQASIKSLDSRDITETGAEIILANTYHLMLRPGEELVSEMGGVHEFMKNDLPMLTDSGGFQVYSLGAGNSETPLTKIDDDGVTFKSHLDGSMHKMTAESSMNIQSHLGADIIMAFDECTPDKSSTSYAREALDRTHAWAKRSYDAWQNNDRLSKQDKYQALFGIVQGAMHKNLRCESAEVICSMDFDGIAIGGETVGYNMEGTVEIMEWIRDILPKDKPIYAMGLGRDPQNIIDAINAGFDMFDCVAPTRLARNGALYHGEYRSGVYESEYTNARLNIANARYAHDKNPILVGCGCYTCSQGYSRAYLRHLYLTKELSYYRLASIHNTYVMVKLSQQIRKKMQKATPTGVAEMT